MTEQIEKLNLESKDLVEENVERLKQLFPEVVTEGNGTVDFEKLRLILGDNVNTDQERYGFTWPGKADAIRLAQTPSKATLRPCVEKSRSRDGEDGSFDSDNIYIEGDNLEVLKLLQRSYHGKIKMIYIDPPYNTGHDFVYKDTFADSIKNYKEQAGLTNHSNADTSGRFHSNWCSMMYPRLKLARELLADDGFMFVSIGEEELNTLSFLIQSIFGEQSLRNILIVRRYDKNLNQQFVDQGLKSMNVGLEYILVIAKNTDSKLLPVYRKLNESRSAEGYWKGFWNAADRPTMRYEILGFTPTEGQWKWKKSVAEEAVANYQEYLECFEASMTLEEYWKSTGKSKKFLRRRTGLTGKNAGVEHWVAPTDTALRSSNWSDLLISRAVKDLPFESPKNPNVIAELMKMSCDGSSIVLDFFSGSASSAEAILQLNADDDCSYKFIMVQLPEVCDEKSEAAKAGYKNICDIGEERIRRAGNKIKAELEESNRQLKIDEEPKELPDIGFRVFKLDESGIKEPSPDELLPEVVKSGRTELDIVYEMMLDWGLDLSLPVEREYFDGYSTWSVGAGDLICCVEDGLTPDILRAIADSSPRRVLMFDSILDDSLKLNALQIFDRARIELRTV